MLMHSENAPAAMLVTDEGILTVVKPTHWLNAANPIDFTFEGMVTLGNLLHNPLETVVVSQRDSVA